MAGGILGVLIGTMSDLHALKLILVSSIFLMAYDTILMFPSEVRLIWRRKWSMGKALYLVCRYPVMIVQIVSLILTLRTDCSLTLVKELLIFKYWMASLCATPVQILMGIRTYAPYGGSIPIKWLIIALFVGEQLLAVAMTAVLTALTEFKKFPLKGVSCFLDAPNAPKSAGVALFAGAAAYDTILSCLLLARFFTAVRQGNSGVAWIIYNSGLVYFIIVTLFCTTEFFLFVIMPNNRLLIPVAMAYTIEAVGTVLSCRLILHLRVYMHQDDTSTGAGQELFSMSVNPPRLGSLVFANKKHSGAHWTQSHSESDDAEPMEEQYEIPTRSARLSEWEDEAGVPQLAKAQA